MLVYTIKGKDYQISNVIIKSKERKKIKIRLLMLVEEFNNCIYVGIHNNLDDKKNQ